MSDKAQVAVLISGRGSNMAALLYAAKHPDCPYELCLVAANDPEAAGLLLAKAEGIATFAHPHEGMNRAAHDAIMHDAIMCSGAQYIALAGYMRILTPEFVRKWDGRMVNIHPSLLPEYKGLHTHERAISAGDSHGGCSVHLVTAELDDGPVLAQTKVAILPDDTADTLAARVLFAEHQLYPKALADYVSRHDDPDFLIAEVGRRALALPETHARESHGAPGWRVGSESSGKFFAYVIANHHGQDGIYLLAKTSGADEMAALIEADPDLYHRPAYYGASGWIGIRLGGADTDWELVDHWLRKSWMAVAPKRLAAAFDAIFGG
jgi:phosphoribosylglycinamide formyltransferase 1